MQKTGTSNIVIFTGEKGREILKKISNTRPKTIDHEKKVEVMDVCLTRI
jgi:hypothetical protein